MSLANQKLEIIAEIAKVEAHLIEQSNLAGISTTDLAAITATLTAEINAAVSHDALDALNLGIEQATALTNTLARYSNEGAADNVLIAFGGGNVGIGGLTAGGAKVTIHPTQADGAGILRFETERQWVFKQDGAGSNAQLTLQSLNAQKSFNLQSSTGEYIARFLTGSALPDIRLAEQVLARVGVGPLSAPDVSAKLEVFSIDKGFLPPRQTTVQRDAIVSPAGGLEVFNSDVNRPNYFDGTAWRTGGGFQPENRVYVTSAADLPAPSGGVITLQENTEYVFYNDDPTISQKTITLSDRLAIPDAGGCRITTTGLATVLLNYSGTGNFFTTSDTFTGFFSIDNIFISAPTGTLFDISGVLPIGSEFFPRFFCWSMGFFDTATIGTIQNISFNYNVGAFFDCGQGLVCRNLREMLISDVRFTDWKNEVSAVMLTTYGSFIQPKIAGCVFDTQVNETVFDLQPNLLEDEQLIVAANVIRGAGTVFKTGTSGAITAVANQSFSGAAIDSVAGTPFGESLFTTNLAHGLVVGQEIIHTTFADSNYNNTFLVLEVLSATQYRVHALFTATGTGTMASNIIEITSSAHGLAVGDAVNITDSLDSNDYDGPATVIDVFDVNTFQINRTFVATDTGANWNTDSLDQNAVNTKFGANTGVPDSSSRVGIIMNTNGSLTTVVDGTYGPIVLTNLLVNPAVAARFRTIDLAAGIFRYVGLDPVTFSANAAFNVVKSGSTEAYRLAASINGVPPVFASAPHISVEVKTTKVQAGGPNLLTLQSGDTIQFMIAGDGTADSLTLTDLSVTLQGT